MSKLALHKAARKCKKDERFREVMWGRLTRDWCSNIMDSLSLSPRGSDASAISRRYSDDESHYDRDDDDDDDRGYGEGIGG